MEQEIREYALEIGFDDVGFTTAEPFPQLTEALEERQAGYSWISEGLLQLAHVADPKFVLPSARSIVVLIYDFYKQAYPQEFNERIGKSYQSRLYPGKTRLFGSRLRLIREFLESRGLEVGVRPAMAERQAAVRAGLGTFRRNTFVYSPGRGSYIGIVAMAVSAGLEPATARKEPACPEDCRRCIEACPTGALHEPYKMDPLRCIAFNTFGTGNFPGAPDDIEPVIREKMGGWIYGCDLCQDVCPHNQARLKQKLVPDAYLREMVHKFDLPALLAMDDRYFVDTVQQLFYGYLWEKKFIQRNAAIALGNRGDEGAVPLLARAMSDPQEMVRKYSAWALGRIGGKKSRAALGKALAAESEAAVSAEIKAALENC